MKKIVKRRRTFRINNPLAFGILCAMILILLAGVTYALVAGVISPAIVQYRVANATPAPTPSPTPAEPFSRTRSAAWPTTASTASPSPAMPIAPL